MKLQIDEKNPDDCGRTPRGVRGLKPVFAVSAADCDASHSARGAWIETLPWSLCALLRDVALREGCVD